ncbi:phytanoyl-CoA dioxygenase family protein [Aeoliella sp. SH292]|uniref:phytanoyl-CoA dioxygenase family protein n=1 Tax=Aeoliella sp. SH292 TaxID=3454464 RepID=UPI003F9A9ADB
MIVVEAKRHFDELGFVVFEGVLDPLRDLQPVIDDYAALLDRLSKQWVAEGRLGSTHAHLPFVERLTRIMAESSINVSRYLDISLPDSQVYVDEPMHLSDPIFRLLTNPKLLDIVEDFVGPEILSNPVQHVRIKPPEKSVQGKFEQDFLVRRTGWHQDQGVIRADADDTPILTVWIPICDATENNGCLAVIPGSHRRGLAHHCPGGNGLTIPERLLESQAMPLPMKPGSILCLHRLTKHSSLPNNSDTVRWSFDLRYQPDGLPTGRDEYPSFLVRSTSRPEAVVSDFNEWVLLWQSAKERLSHADRQVKHRWPQDAPVCA